MNAWETAGRGTPRRPPGGGPDESEFDTAIATNPRAESAGVLPNRASFHEGQGKEAVSRFRTEFLLRLCDTPRDARSPEEKALDKVLATYPKAQERSEVLRRQPDFTLEKAGEKIKAEFKEHYLWQLDESRVLARMERHSLRRHPEYQ